MQRQCIFLIEHKDALITAFQLDMHESFGVINPE